MQRKKRMGKVVLGMSGGVDSTIAALCLLQEGFSVTGVTFCFFDDLDPGLNEKDNAVVSRAARICSELDIPHMVINVGRDFKNRVVRAFINSYRTGETPNPCILCNEHIKFPFLAGVADSIGAEWISTGHYARVVKYGSRIFLAAARDTGKDQSYFLYRVPVKYLRRTIFPLGEKSKNEVREIARENGLTGYVGKESQDVCFIPDNNLNGFLDKFIDPRPGDVVDSRGDTIGKHRGICFYTVGQRKGLGISASTPLYVKETDPLLDRITLVKEEELYSRKAVCGSLKLRIRKFDIPLKAKIRFRHRATAVEAVQIEAGKLTVTFSKAQRAVTPGQSLVLYKDGLVVGGGVFINRRDKWD
ncbi:tRNA 2-thiouridine(34) synthase MnmA [bacterium]|nr:tRNA 2-thiouridine(34) synthase MnmA [bacterium]